MTAPIPLRPRLIVFPEFCKAIVIDDKDGQLKRCPYHAEFAYTTANQWTTTRSREKCFCLRHHRDLEKLFAYQETLKRQERAPEEVELRIFLQRYFFHFVHANDGHHVRIQKLQRRLECPHHLWWRPQFCLTDASTETHNIHDTHEHQQPFDSHANEDESEDTEDTDSDEELSPTVRTVLVETIQHPPAPHHVADPPSNDQPSNDPPSRGTNNTIHTPDEGKRADENEVEGEVEHEQQSNDPPPSTPAHEHVEFELTTVRRPTTRKKKNPKQDRKKQPTTPTPSPTAQPPMLFRCTNAISAAIRTFANASFDMLTYALNHDNTTPVPPLPDFARMVEVASRARASDPVLARIVTHPTLKEVASRIMNQIWGAAGLLIGPDVHYTWLTKIFHHPVPLPDGGPTLKHPTWQPPNPHAASFKPDEMTPVCRRIMDQFDRQKTFWNASQSPHLKRATIPDLMQEWDSTWPQLQSIDLRSAFADHPFIAIMVIFKIAAHMYMIVKDIIGAADCPRLCDLMTHTPCYIDRRRELTIELNLMRMYLRDNTDAEDAQPYARFVDAFAPWTTRIVPITPILCSPIRAMLRTKSPLYAWLQCVTELERHRPGSIEDQHALLLRTLSLTPNSCTFYLPTDIHTARLLSLHFREPTDEDKNMNDEAVEEMMYFSLCHFITHAAHFLLHQGPQRNGRVETIRMHEDRDFITTRVDALSPLWLHAHYATERTRVALQTWMLTEWVTGAVLVARETGTRPDTHPLAAEVIPQLLLKDRPNETVMAGRTWYTLLREYLVRIYYGTSRLNEFPATASYNILMKLMDFFQVESQQVHIACHMLMLEMSA
jgi:hypothetical protein